MERSKRSTTIEQRREQVQRLRREMQENTEELRALELKTQSLKAELNKIKKLQLDFYHDLLSEGTDCRQEGLIWILKVIWNLGADVALTRLPRFLDEKAVEFLFNVAKIASHP